MTAPEQSPHPLVQVRNVHKRFLHEGHQVSVLKGIDLTIERGEMLAVVGASGAGKSTLLHILGTLDLPTAGSIAYEGDDVTGYSSARLAQFRNETIGFVFQFHHLLPEFTALENVMMPGMIRGLRGPAPREKALSLLREVGLEHRLSHRPGELSGGEQQRVALARALVMEPKVVLADEPTGNLDSNTSESIHQLFTTLNEKLGTTFLIVTHSGDLAGRMPRMVRMRDGRIVEDVRRTPSGETISAPDDRRESVAPAAGDARASPEASVPNASAEASQRAGPGDT